jgi:hypothetical protein
MRAKSSVGALQNSNAVLIFTKRKSNYSEDF